MKSLFAELKRRNVIRVGIFYGAGAWLILQVADVLLEIADAPEGSLRLIAIVLALGFPFALLLAWAFEITPDGIKLESQVDRSADSAAAAQGRKLDMATIALLVLAIALLAWDQIADRAARAPPVDGARDLSIAVLPFVNMSVDAENEYFSDGLSEELLNVLARIEDFRVAGRTSSFAFKDQAQDLRAIGERLNVANILEGSVRKQGDRVRVTAQLIDARSGYHLWSDTYDRRLDDIFAIQDEIATEVVKALRRTLLAADQAVIQQSAKGDVEAYNHYLRGQFHARLRTRAGLERALEEFHQATLIDPGYAPPYAGIAMVYALLDNYRYRSLAQTRDLAERALERALALDPLSDEAWAIKGLLLTQGTGARQRESQALQALQRAIEINPNNALAHLWIAPLLAPDHVAVGASLRRAYELDPLSPIILYRRTIDATNMRDEVGLARAMAELQEVAPDWFMTWMAAGRAALLSGHVAEAARDLERAVQLNPDYPGSVVAFAQALEMLGYRERAESLVVEADERLADPEIRVVLAAMRARTAVLEGRSAEAAEIFGSAVEALEAPTDELLADWAILEIGARQHVQAENRMRAVLGLDADEVPESIDPDELLPAVVLAAALAAQGDRDQAAALAGALRRVLRQLADQGLKFNYIPLADGFAGYLLGQPDELGPGLREALRQGYRGAPGSHHWLLEIDPGSAEMRLVVQSLDEVLAEERVRYEAARASS